MSNPDKPLKPYRSKAERTAVLQRNVQIALTVLVLIVSLTNLLMELF